MLGLSKSHFSNHHNVQVFRKTSKFLATKMEEFDNPSRPVHIPLLDNENFFSMGIEPNGWHFDTFKLIKCTCGLILQMSPVEFWDISEAFLSAARLMDSASRIP